jgi:hypothetical protein
MTDAEGSAVPRALKHRLLTEVQGTPEQCEAEEKRTREILAQVEMALVEAQAKKDQPDAETPVELATLMVSTMDMVKGLRTIDLCLNGGIKYNLYEIFRDAKQKVRAALKIIDTEAGRTLRCKVEQMHLARFPQEEAAKLTALIRLSKELVDRKDMGIWDTTVTALPATVFGVEVVMARSNMAGIRRKTSQVSSFVRGPTLPGNQPPESGTSTPDTGMAVAGGSGGQPGQGAAGHVAPGQWPAGPVARYNMAPPPTAARPFSVYRTGITLPPGWEDLEAPAAIPHGRGFMEYFKQNHLPNYTPFSGDKDDTVTLAELWSKYKDDVHVRPIGQCSIEARLKILCTMLLTKKARAMAEIFTAGDVESYTAVWAALWKEWGNSVHMQRVIKDQARALVPESADVEHQRQYYMQMERFSSRLGHTGMPKNKVHCFIIKEIQRKIRDDIWTKIKMELRLANKRDDWFKEDPGGAKIAFSQALLDALRETEDRQNEAGDTAVPVYVSAGPSTSSSQEGKKPRMASHSGPPPQREEEKEEAAQDTWEAYVASQYPERKPAGPKPRMVAYAPCIMCGDEEHGAMQCAIKDRHIRFNLFRQRNMCFNCCNKGCSVATCPHPMQCRTCKGTERAKHSPLMCFFEELPVKQLNKFAEKAEKPRFQEAPQSRRKPLIRERTDNPEAQRKPRSAPRTAGRAYFSNEAEESQQESEEEVVEHGEEQQGERPQQGQPLDSDLLAAQILHLQELQRQAEEKEK